MGYAMKSTLVASNDAVNFASGKILTPIFAIWKNDYSS